MKPMILAAATFLTGFIVAIINVFPFASSPTFPHDVEVKTTSSVIAENQIEIGKNRLALATKSSRNLANSTFSDDLLNIDLKSRSAELSKADSVQFKMQNETFSGRQIAWDRDQLVVMLASGRMRTLRWNQLQALKSTDNNFIPSTPIQIQTQLQQEFGSNYRVNRSRDFLVVQPRSSTRPWANRMQQFLGNVQTYFSARRFPMASGKFTMVAVVFPDRRTFEAHAAAAGESVPSNYVAYYSLMSNRVYLYESEATETLDIGTVYHEAFHQIAFNTGIHFRSASPPRWIAEGMATAFETPGMYDHRNSGSRRDRLHPYYRRAALNYLSSPTAQRDIATLIADDQAFQLNPAKAYCLSWSLAFYLMEFQPQAFSNFLDRTNRREAFADYPSSKRKNDFHSLAPNGTADLSRKLLNFYQEKSNR